MNRILYSLFLLLVLNPAKTFADRSFVPDVTLITPEIPAADINQGSSNNIIYAVQASVATDPVSFTNIQFTVSGTHDADDLASIYIYFNPTSVSVSGATLLNSVTAGFAGPHVYSVSIFRNMTAGSTGYFIIVANVNPGATDNNTVKINGATNPVVFTYSVASNITNNQSDAAGTQTLQAADITLTTSVLPSADVNQGSTNNIVYAAHVSVATEPVQVSSIQFTLNGTHDANDLISVYVYFNATSPSVSGATLLNSTAANFAAPHLYNLSVFRAMAAGSSGYFLIVANIENAATDNNTIKINGASSPVSFGFSTTPNVTNSQADNAGTFTIQAADITLSSVTVAASNFNQGSTNNIVYATQVSVATEPVQVSSIQFTLDGTYDNNDLLSVYVYFNASGPTISGATLLNSTAANFAGPHLYSLSIFRAMSAGSSGYFIIVANVDNLATDNNTLKINGGTNPISFGYSTSPNHTNNQTDAAGTHTIQAADITLTSFSLPAADISQGSNNNIIYAAHVSVSNQPVQVSSIQFTLDGTHDNNDLVSVYVYFNATAPIISGATLLNSTSGAFAAPHDYNISVFRAMSTGSAGYFIIAVNTDNLATDNNTIKINGATSPVSFGYSTAPNNTNNQTDAAGTQTIQAADIIYTSSSLPAADVNQGSTNTILYAAQVSVANQAVQVNNIQFTLEGTHDNNDLLNLYVYFNATSPSISGATLLNSTAANFAGPHTYSMNIFRSMAPASSGYFIIAVNVDNLATDNNTIKINGATNPLVFGYTTSPNSTNSQTDAAGTQTIQAADISLSTVPRNAANIKPGNSNHIVYIAQMNVAGQPVTVNSIQFTLGGTHDADDLNSLYIYFNGSAPTISGATLLNSAPATFAAPHAYSVNVFRTMTAGSTGYFIIAVNTNPTATVGNTVHINGATNPVVFGFVTGPNVTNNQSNAAGVQTLPVSLLSFTANLAKDEVVLKWATSSEINNAYFGIEHSVDGINFKPIGRITGSGTTNTAKQYSYTHGQPSFGSNYYRLKQTDLDGNYQYSPIVLVNYNPGKFMTSSPYPNPASGKVWFKVFAPRNGSLKIEMINTGGSIVYNRTTSLTEGTNNLEIDLSNLAAGIYQMRIIDLKTNSVETKQIIISR